MQKTIFKTLMKCLNKQLNESKLTKTVLAKLNSLVSEDERKAEDVEEEKERVDNPYGKHCRSHQLNCEGLTIGVNVFEQGTLVSIYDELLCHSIFSEFIEKHKS